MRARPDDADEPACAFCGRTGLELTRHHLIPRSRHNKARTRRTFTRQQMKHDLVPACRPCHRTIHATLSEAELAAAYHTVPDLKSHPELQRFFRWAAKQPPDLRVSVRKPRSRR